MPIRYAPLSIHVPREKYCYRCGELLGNSRGTLYLTYRRRSRLVSAISVLTFPFIWLRNFYDFRFGNTDYSCRHCGVDTEREWREDVLGCEQHGPLKRPPLRTVRHTIDVAGSGLPDALPRASFLVYGLAGKPLGLELRSVAWEAGRLSRAVEVVSLIYEAVAEQLPRRRLLLEQAAGARAIALMRSPARELRAIVEVVQEHGAEGQRERYADRGNVFRHWNLERLAATPRRIVELSVGGVPVRVEVVQWSDPQQVTVARMSLGGIAVLAAAVDVPPARLMAMLKGLAPLGGGSRAPTRRV